MNVEARIVSAAATNFRSHSNLNHAVMLDTRGRKLLVICGKVTLLNLADAYDVAPVDCPRCLRFLRKDAKA